MAKVTLEREKLGNACQESYKALRTNLQFCGKDIKVVSLTSCQPNEGKSTVCFYLSEALAEDHKKVLFVDADLRKSVIVGRYQVGKINGGLTEYLVGKAELEDVICTTDVEGLDMVFAGVTPPNPSELLGQERFEEFIAQVRERYDYIIIDTPPIGSVIDAAVVAKKTDGVIMVIASNQNSCRDAQRMKKQLENAQCHILGAVLNKVNIKKKGYGSYYGNS